jgi:hypothetical protein
MGMEAKRKYTTQVFADDDDLHEGHSGSTTMCWQTKRRLISNTNRELNAPRFIWQSIQIVLTLTCYLRKFVISTITVIKIRQDQLFLGQQVMETRSVQFA